MLALRMIYGTTLQVGDSSTSIVLRDLAERPDILSVKVWNTDGTLAWANLAPERIGKKFPVDGELAEVLETKEATAELSTLSDEEDSVEAAELPDNVVEVYAPLFAGQHEVVGAYEVYADAEPLEASIASRKRTMWIATAMLFAFLWLLLMLLARNASGDAPPSDDDPPRALCRPQRVLPPAGGELPRSDREPEPDCRGEGPVHGRALAPRATDRPSPSRKSSEPHRRTSTPSALAASSTTSARSRSRTSS